MHEFDKEKVITTLFANFFSLNFTFLVEKLSKNDNSISSFAQSCRSGHSLKGRMARNYWNDREVRRLLYTYVKHPE